MVLGILGLSAGPCENGPDSENLQRDFPSVFFVLKKKALFARSLVQLILVALSLYRFGAKEEGLFTAPQAPGLDSGLLERPALNFAFSVSWARISSPGASRAGF